MIAGEAFDGWAHMLKPGEHFEFPTAKVLEYEEEPDGTEDYYELPVPVEVGTTDLRARYQNPLPLQYEQQGWAALCIALKALSRILGGTADSFQNSHYEDGRLVAADFSFRFIPGEGLWSGGRL